MPLPLISEPCALGKMDKAERGNDEPRSELNKIHQIVQAFEAHKEADCSIDSSSQLAGKVQAFDKRAG